MMVRRLACCLTLASAFGLAEGAHLRQDVRRHNHTGALVLETSGRIIIKEDGEEHVYYLSKDVGDGDQVPKDPVFLNGGKSVKIPFDSRFYIMTKPGLRSSPNREDFKIFSLMDKTLKYTMDLHGAGCGCNAAVYTISMPGAGPGANNDWYCDANNIGGQACPEFDLTECNKHAKITVAHGCQWPWHEGNCDKWGHGHKFWSEALGRGAFTVEHKFSWTQVTTTISQGGWSESKTLGGLNSQFGMPHLGGSSNGMSEALRDGQVLALSFWGNHDLSWLDDCPRPYWGQGTFQGYGNPNSCVPFYTISDITLESRSVSPTPGPGPSGGCCKWGDQCGDCGNDGSGWCHQSASNCAACTGFFDANSQAPACR